MPDPVLIKRLEESQGFQRRKVDHNLKLVHCPDCGIVGWVHTGGKALEAWQDVAAVCLKAEGISTNWRYSPHTPAGVQSHSCRDPEVEYFTELPGYILKRLCYAYEEEEVPA
jgi:hypothetical protein